MKLRGLITYYTTGLLSVDMAAFPGLYTHVGAHETGHKEAALLYRVKPWQGLLAHEAVHQAWLLSWSGHTSSPGNQPSFELLLCLPSQTAEHDSLPHQGLHGVYSMTSHNTA